MKFDPAVIVDTFSSSIIVMQIPSSWDFKNWFNSINWIAPVPWLDLFGIQDINMLELQ